MSQIQVSIHQPEFNRTTNGNEDVIMDKIDDLSNISSTNISENDNIINDVSMAITTTTNITLTNMHNEQISQITQWPLQTSKGAECEGIFGNGYSKELISCSTDLSEFRCFQNPFSNQMYCTAKNLIINPSMIQISNGGEAIKDVSGRREEDEFPKYLHNKDTGDTAFNIDCEPQGSIPQKNGISYYLHDIIKFLRDANVGNESSKYHQKYMSDYSELCTDTHNDDKMSIFLLTMRYEYANMYHQATDWYNFYQLIHSLGINDRYEIIFLDGHAQSQIDAAWQYGINSHYSFIKQLNNGKAICLKNALFVSAGYVGGISLKTVFKGCKAESKYVRGFGPWFLNGFGIKAKSERKYNNISITLICRKDYVAHPRNMIGKASRKFHNDEEVERKIRNILHSVDGIEFNLRSVAWSDYSFREQLGIAASTDILIGVHGAGLSHVLFLPHKSGLIEITPSGFDGEPHFKALSNWCGHAYHQVRGGSESKVDPNTDALKQAILKQIDFVKSNVY